jgi:hypothetical protein
MIDDNHDDSEKTDEQLEEHLNDIERQLAICFATLEETVEMFRPGKHTLFLDEAGALNQCKKDVGVVIDSFERRRENRNEYNQPERVAELLVVQDSDDSDESVGDSES